jgi:predicted CopG family antitoxin
LTGWFAVDVILSQLKIGPKKSFSDTIIKKVRKVENAVEIIEHC